MYADRMRSKTYPARPSRRALAHVRAAAGLPKRARGAPPGNHNRLTHGLYATAFVARRRKTKRLLEETRDLVVLLARATDEVATRTPDNFSRTRAWPIITL